MKRVARDKQQGFTLTEVLIAVLVLATGLLGLAGLQLAGMKSNYSAYLRTQATIAAYDLLDRMRANPAGFVGRRLVFDRTIDSGVAAFDAWEELVESLELPDPVAGRGAEDTKGVLDCTVNSPTDQSDCSSGNFCGAGNCALCVRWNDTRGEPGATGRTSGSAPAGRDVEALQLRVCSHLPGAG